MHLVLRIRTMSPREIVWRTRTALRNARQRTAAAARQPEWDRGDLSSVLAPNVLDSHMRSAINRSDWTLVHAILASRIVSRPSLFILDPATVDDLRAGILRQWPDAPMQARSRADRILDGELDVLGYRDINVRREDGEIDWHFDPVHGRRAPRVWWGRVPYLSPEVGDHKIIWEINRQQFWLPLVRALWLTRDRRYARGITSAFESWLAANPPLTGINWASMLEIAFRAMSWTWALHGLLGFEAHEEYTREDHEGHDAWLPGMFVGLHHQLAHVEQNLSYYFSPNTHLTGEALGLYVVGTALPELAASSQWAATGRRILLKEIERQILPDGGHAERSTHYQRYTLDFYLMALLTAQRAGDAEGEALFGEAVSRLAAFTRTIATSRGRLPLIGDDDGGMLWPMTGREANDVRDSLALAAVVLRRPGLVVDSIPEEVFWIGGMDAIERAPAIVIESSAHPEPVSNTFPDTGYVIMRNGVEAHAVFDAGLHGYMNGGHAHADALALTLNVGSRPFLVDPGTSTYTMDKKLRDVMRSSMSHNTVTIDDKPQARPAGPFHWRTRADARLHGTRHTPAFDWAEGSHNGYAPLTHRRTVFRAGADGWLVADEILGSGRHTAAAHWHFDPSWMLTYDAPGRLRARHLDGDMAWLLHDGGRVSLVHGDEEAGLGWFAPVYGTLVPTWTARVTRYGIAPFASLTWIGPASAHATSAPLLKRVATTADPAGRAVAARVADDDRALVFLFRPGEPPVRESRGCGVLDYQTNARAFQYEVRGERLFAMSLVDGSRALALREGWISLAASESIGELRLAIDAGRVLTISTSTPPSQLRIQGGAFAECRAIRLNGREVVRQAGERADACVLHGGDWGTALPKIPTPHHTSLLAAASS
jgi:hypothetical protein